MHREPTLSRRVKDRRVARLSRARRRWLWGESLFIVSTILYHHEFWSRRRHHRIVSFCLFLKHTRFNFISVGTHSTILAPPFFWERRVLAKITRKKVNRSDVWLCHTEIHLDWRGWFFTVHCVFVLSELRNSVVSFITYLLPLGEHLSLCRRCKW